MYREIVDIEVENIIVLNSIIFLTAMPQKWTSNEQEEFLTSMLEEFCMHTAAKKYKEFWKKVNKLFFEKWPERRALFGNLPADHILTPDQVKDLANTVESHEQKKSRTPQMPKSEYRMLLTTGPKLNKCHEVTCCLYSEECKDVKNKVERHYQKANAKAKHAKACLCQKSGKMPKIDDATKIKAIHELGPMIDWILKYLAYATGGWKFTILMGGKDPSTGEVSVFNYHVGELESGAQFDQTCTKFDVVQAAFLAFVKDTLAFESTLPHDSDAEDAEDSSSDSHDGSDEEWATMSGSEHSEEGATMNGSEHGDHHVEEEDLDDLLPNSIHQINTAGMYQMTPQSESSINNFGATIASIDASLPCAQILGDASSGSQLPSDSHLASFNNPPNLPVFDHKVFTALINDPDFNINILDALPEAPPLQSNPYPEVFIPPAPHTDDASSTQYPEIFIPLAPRANDTSSIQYPQVFIPPAPHTDDASSTQYPKVFIPLAPPTDDAPSAQYLQVVIPPAPDASSAQYLQVIIPPAPPTDDASSAQYSQVIIPPAPHADVEDMGTPNESDGASASPASSVQAGAQRHHGRHTQQCSQLTMPTSSAEEIQPLPDGHHQVCKPFNARERDNDIGGPMKICSACLVQADKEDAQFEVHTFKAQQKGAGLGDKILKNDIMHVFDLSTSFSEDCGKVSKVQTREARYQGIMPANGCWVQPNLVQEDDASVMHHIPNRVLKSKGSKEKESEEAEGSNMIGTSRRERSKHMSQMGQ
ncbi:uncharacterized protein BJ212DRAFT_1534062 [Suillus subaureus]|uniref:Uncharacterized protein n=1 Tax=Suillus subaureus TaxID=48587 RepID=A0A9P7EKQ0_9AGAM|nr:uncharacterized protein BJ212DRAFT_1534062 [Suillus subaureus]KAG1823939.1 hypothetical protein BJ212DRAFT_1534062 [Suillus subaureus]